MLINTAMVEMIYPIVKSSLPKKGKLDYKCKKTVCIHKPSVIRLSKTKYIYIYPCIGSSVG